jgi:hypothetical protein
MTKQNLILLGVGLAFAYVTYNALKNREKKTQNATIKSAESTGDTSDFCGCGA